MVFLIQDSVSEEIIPDHENKMLTGYLGLFVGDIVSLLG